MKIKYDEKLRLNNANKRKLAIIEGILSEYLDDGYKLTLRQLYYQLVSRGIIPNEKQEYQKLSNLLKKGRMAGVVDWNAIEDRIRVPKLPYWVHDIQDALDDTVSSYRLNRMQGQENNIEVWVEKDALSSILYRVTSKYHIRLMVNRGYSSVTAMHDASRRLSEGDTILYFGDHDPSGLDMIRDIEDRLGEFGKPINVVQVALNMEQIRLYEPPPNPTKVSDPRAGWYLEEYGETSWELDALPPEVLTKLLTENIESRIDLDKYHKMVKREREEVEIIRRFAEQFDNDH